MGLLICDADGSKPIGVSKCSKMPVQFVSMITTPQNYTIPFASATTATQWQQDILAAPANRITAWPNASSIENLSEENVYNEQSTGTQKVRDGRYRFRYFFDRNINYEQFKKMQTYTGIQGGVFLVDADKQVWGWSNDEINFNPFTIDLLDPQNMTINDGSVNAQAPVRIDLSDPTEVNLQMYNVDALSFYQSIIPLTLCRFSLSGTPSATEIIVNIANDNDGVPVLGLVQADFVIGSGSISGVSEDSNGQGQYTITGTGMGGLVSLIPPATLSVVGFDGTAGIESGV